MKDIARETGLGLATISSYLNGRNVRENNRIKIEEAIERLHFEVNEVARGLKTNRTKIIGMIIPEFTNIFCSKLAAEIEDILRAHEYAMLICDCRTDERREAEAAEFLKKKRVDGLIVMPVGKDGGHFSPFLKNHKPVILIDRMLKKADFDCVLVDNRGAARNAIERLVKLGHQRIGIIAGEEGLFPADERLGGYLEVLGESKIPVQERSIIRSDGTITGGAAGMRRLLQQNKDLTAVFIANHEMTMGALIEVNEQGLKIPDEISLIGFDNVDFARACVPRLSIVTQPAKEIAKHTVRLLLSRLEAEENGWPCKKELIHLQASLIEGSSVKDIRC